MAVEFKLRHDRKYGSIRPCLAAKQIPRFPSFCETAEDGAGAFSTEPASYNVQGDFAKQSVDMLPCTCRSIVSRLGPVSTALLISLVATLAFTQDVAVTRLPIDTDMAVRLTNLTSHVNYERSGNSYFIVPVGRYSVQLLRNGQVAYQEVEYIDANAPATRTVNPQRMEIVVGLPDGGPQFDPSVCAALEAAARVAIRTYGLHDADLQRRLSNAQIASAGGSCATTTDIDDVGQTVAGSYGVTPLGLVALSIEYTPLAPQHRPRNQGNSPIYRDPSTQRLATAQQPKSNLTPALIADLENGMTDVAFDSANKPLLVCAAIDANTPVFCDSNGLAAATPAIANLRGLYRFSAKTTPVDHWGAELDHWTNFVRENEYEATQDRLAAAVATLKGNLELGITDLQAKSGDTPGARNRTANVGEYPTPDLAALVNATQAEFDQALHEEMLRPLRQHFPAAISRLRDPAAPVTSDQDAQRVFRELRNAVSVLEKVSDNLAIDLVFRTAPVEAEGAHLDFVNCARCTPIVSQGGQHLFYRGKYYIQATLDGYVAYEGWLDLVEDPHHILECDMVRVRRVQSRHASSCSFRAQ
jgi:hypothetical protein